MKAKSGVELDLEKRVKGEQAVEKWYEADVDGKQMQVMFSLKLTPKGSTALVDIDYGSAKHRYKDGKKEFGLPLSNEKLLDAMQNLLPKEVQQYVPELVQRKQKAEWVMVESSTNELTSRKVFERNLGSTKLVVEYSLRSENGRLVPWVAVTNGKTAKVYRDGERLSQGMPAIQNEKVKQALRELPNEIGAYIPELQ